jgi:hypothetical protein
MAYVCKGRTIDFVVERKDGGWVLANDLVVVLLGLGRGST